VGNTNRPTQLADCALALFASRGIDGVKMDDIAAKADVTKGSLYYHFKSKDEVIQAACRQYYQNWHRKTQALITGVVSAKKQLEIAIRTSVQACLIDEGNRVFTMEIMARSMYDKPVRDGWRQFFDGVKAFYLSLAETAMEKDGLKLEDPESAVDTMLAAMEGYKLRAIFEPELCSKRAEKSIAKDLLSLVNIG
jgi:AcrR family transcriptional regulator